MSRIVRFESRIARSKPLANRMARFDSFLESVKNSEALRAIRTVVGRIVRFEIAAKRWRVESLRTANRDSRNRDSRQLS